LVFYWYQSRDRAIASEYKAKFWVVVDSMRLNRTDTALVRVVVPIVGNDQEAATRVASDFVRSFYGTLRQYLPS
jgi:EpsI family protein